MSTGLSRGNSTATTIPGDDGEAKRMAIENNKARLDEIERAKFQKRQQPDSQVTLNLNDCSHPTLSAEQAALLRKNGEIELLKADVAGTREYMDKHKPTKTSASNKTAKARKAQTGKKTKQMKKPCNKAKKHNKKVKKHNKKVKKHNKAVNLKTSKTKTGSKVQTGPAKPSAKPTAPPQTTMVEPTKPARPQPPQQVAVKTEQPKVVPVQPVATPARSDQPVPSQVGLNGTAQPLPAETPQKPQTDGLGASAPTPDTVKQLLNRATTQDQLTPNQVMVTAAEPDKPHQTTPGSNISSTTPDSGAGKKEKKGRDKQLHARKMRFYRSLESHSLNHINSSKIKVINYSDNFTYTVGQTDQNHQNHLQSQSNKFFATLPL